MDLVDDLVGSMTIEDSRYVRITARAPWGIAFPARPVARLVLVRGGPCRLSGAHLDAPEVLTEQACVLVRSGATFELQDAPGRRLVDCEASPDGGAPEIGGDGAVTEIHSSRFAVDAVAAEALFGLLPPLTRIDLDDASGRLLRATVDLIARETDVAGPGLAFVRGRLSEALFVQALRACAAGAGPDAVGWLAAVHEPQLATAMRALHADIARPWTVDELARTAGMSRSSFAALFSRVAGETPLGHLTTWRMYQAKRLLRGTSKGVHEIALEVGYGTGQALSRAFLRREGVPPGEWRRART